ncbi:MAG: helix-turn-helix transcriptional regulator [Lentisphaerae bacterium]|nr:helix-turn-helix transcriptional regulator [Lentisphaerota bacterium]
MQSVFGVHAAVNHHLECFYSHEIPRIVKSLDAGDLSENELHTEYLTRSNPLALNTYKKELCEYDLDEIVTLVLRYDQRKLAILILGWKKQHALLRGPELSVLELLLPSIRRAIILRENLSEMRFEVAMLMKGINALAFGAVCTDLDGVILTANATAQRMLDNGKYIRSVKGRLQGANRSVTEELLQAIKRVSNTSMYEHGVDVILPYENEGTIAHVIGLSGNEVYENANSVAFILIADPSSTYSAGIDAFGNLYELTQAEKAVLRQLISGKSPDEIAKQLNISIATVRTHLARLFAKTKTSGQVGLVARVRQICLPIAS